MLSIQNLMLRWTPHPVIVTIFDNKDHFRILLYSYDTTITGWGVPSNLMPLWIPEMAEELREAPELSRSQLLEAAKDFWDIGFRFQGSGCRA